MKTKKIIAAVAALAMVCGAVPSQPFANIVKNSAVTASAEDDSETGEYGVLTYRYSEDYGYGMQITGCDKSVTEVEIPDEINGKTVIGIDYAAFKDCKELEKVVLPEGLGFIGNDAFRNCVSLKSIDFPDSLEGIGACAFMSCSSLESVVFPESFETIDDSAFYGCTNLRSVTITGETISVIAQAFDECKNLTEIIFPDNFSYIEDGYSLTGTKWFDNLPDGVVYLGRLAFKYKGEMPENTELVLENGTTKILDRAFAFQENLTSVKIPDSVTSIGSNAFYFCSNLTSVTLSDNITSIGHVAFMRCFRLEEITIPDGVTDIGEMAFFECGFSSVTIPESVVSIGENALGFKYNEEYQIVNKEDFTISGYKGSAAETYATENEFEFIALDDSEETSDFEFDAETGTITKYVGSATEVVIPSEIDGVAVTKIGGRSFSWNENIEKIVMPDTITEIEYYAFNQCANLKTIVFSKNLKKIGENSFGGCKAINELSLPESLEEIGCEAFYNCNGLSKVVFPDGIKIIAERAFGWCDNLKSVKYPETAEVDKNAFKDSRYITDPETYYRERETDDEICYNEFLDYSVITGGLKAVDGVITIPSELGGLPVTKIGYEAFGGSKDIEKLVMPDTVTEIEYDAFTGCSNLKTIVFSKNLKKIGKNAFESCKSVSELSLPDSLEEIGYEAFAECSGLTSIILPDSVTSIGIYAFEWCEGLTEIIIPDSVINIGEDAFEGCDNLTIRGSKGSAAETYAKENEIKFVSLDEPEEISDFEFDAETGTITKYNGKDTEVVIPSEIDGVAVKAIGESAFYECESLTKITIPDGITSIGDFAFQSCSSVTEITIPDSVTSIGIGAFAACLNLKKVTLPDGITTIGILAFGVCKSLESVTIPESVTSIGAMAFYDTLWLEQKKTENPLVIVNDTVIDGFDCSSGVTVPADVTSICEQSLGYEIVEENNVVDIVKIEDFVIKGYKGSAAETYATENGFEFIVLDDEPITETKLGDVDGDGQITAMDASAALTYYVTQPENIEELGFPFNFEAADWDGNGVINAIDASAILTYYVENN